MGDVNIKKLEPLLPLYFLPMYDEAESSLHSDFLKFTVRILVFGMFKSRLLWKQHSVRWTSSLIGD